MKATLRWPLLAALAFLAPMAQAGEAPKKKPDFSDL